MVGWVRQVRWVRSISEQYWHGVLRMEAKQKRTTLNHYNTSAKKNRPHRAVEFCVSVNRSFPAFCIDRVE